MDFSLNELQEMLKTSARDFLKDNYTMSVAREMAKDEKGFTTALWQMMSEMGWMGLVVPEQYGGTGGSFSDLIVLLKEMGSACLGGPFFSSVVYGGFAIIEAGSEEQKRKYLPELAAGRLRFTLAFLEPQGKLSAEGIQTKALPLSNNEFAILGTKLFVPDAHISDYIILAARTGDFDASARGITLFLVDSKMPGVSINLLKTIGGEKQCEVIFDNVEVPAENILGKVDEGWVILEKLLEKATIALCAEMSGAARHLFEITIEYAKNRKAFGHPIGSFQSIQHYFANMLIEIDGSSLVVDDAAWRISTGLSVVQQKSIAKALINESSNHAASLCLQIHGAIGFTEDHDLSTYFKKLKGWEVELGNTHYHLKEIASLVTTT